MYAAEQARKRRKTAAKRAAPAKSGRVVELHEGDL
jgi:hypothetical protein